MDSDEVKKWGSSPEDSDELLAAIANFRTLSIDKKLVCVTALSFASMNYEKTLQAARKKRNDPYKEGLEMIGDLDPNEAEKVYQEKEKRYVHKSVAFLFEDEEDIEIYESDNEEAERPILPDRERKKILKECKRYLMKTEWLMDNWMRKKTEFILFDEGACSETKFNQSDDKQREEMMLEKQQKKMTGKLTARKKMTGEEGNDVFLAPSSALKGQSEKEKYEKGRSSKKHVEGIRKAYTKDFGNKNLTKRQVAVAKHLIDKSALRAGNEKEDKKLTQLVAAP